MSQQISRTPRAVTHASHALLGVLVLGTAVLGVGAALVGNWISAAIAACVAIEAALYIVFYYSHSPQRRRALATSIYVTTGITVLVLIVRIATRL